MATGMLCNSSKLSTHTRIKTLAGKLLLLPFLSLIACNNTEAKKNDFPSKDSAIAAKPSISVAEPVEEPVAALDTAMYNKLVLHLVHDKTSTKWPVKSAFPLPGALLPFKRIVAYYGNLYSKGMGILGQLPPDEMLQRLQSEAKRWAAADPQIPVQPALHYIAVTAQHLPGKDGKYRLRMPSSQIDKVLEMAKKIDAIVFLDVQVGHSSLQSELPLLEKYLAMPNVHLGIDPEFSMKNGKVPSTSIGTFDAEDVNYASAFLKDIVVKNKLAPKVLIVHRFTKGMLTNSRNIKLRREVQVVINMDGFGFPAKKKNSYQLAVVSEPVQFAGFKLFYKNDELTPPYKIMQPADVLKLDPSPIYIQYQ